MIRLRNNFILLNNNNMNNIKEIEKMRDDKFDIFGISYDWKSNKIQFIFETIIPEVLKSVMPEKLWWHQEEQQRIFAWWYDACIEEIKQKAKELYWIDLF